MDTQTLWQWARDADLKFNDPDNWQDAATVWAERLVEEPEYLVDSLGDYLLEIGSEAREKHLTSLLDYIAKVATQKRFLTKMERKYPGDYTHSASTALSMYLSYLGADIMFLVETGIEEMFDNSSEEWWADVCAYDYEYTQGQYEDYKYAQAKDRQMGWDD